MPDGRRRSQRRINLLLSAVAGIALGACVAPVRGEAQPGGLLPASGGGEYELLLTSYSDTGAPIFQSRARLLVHAAEPGAWRVGLLGVDRYDPIRNRWDTILVDSVDPRTEGLREGVELEFVVDGAPDMERLFPQDIPAIAFGLLLEATTMLALCSEQAGLDELRAPGDSAPIDGFEMYWVRPHGGPANRRTVVGGRSIFEDVRDGVAHILIRPDEVRWAMVRGWNDLRMSIGEESYGMRVRLDAESGELLSVEVANSSLKMRDLGEVDEASLPGRDEIDVPADALEFTTPRSVLLRRVEAPGPDSD